MLSAVEGLPFRVMALGETTSLFGGNAPDLYDGVHLTFRYCNSQNSLDHPRREHLAWHHVLPSGPVDGPTATGDWYGVSGLYCQVKSLNYGTDPSVAGSRGLQTYLGASVDGHLHRGFLIQTVEPVLSPSLHLRSLHSLVRAARINKHLHSISWQSTVDSLFTIIIPVL